MTDIAPSRREAWAERMARLIPPFDEGPVPRPPRTLWAFFAWCLRGSFPVLLAASVVSVLAGTAEVISAVLLGTVIDAANASGPDRLWADHHLLFIGIAVFLVGLRPLTFGASALFQAVVIGPSLNVLVLSRLFRWTLGQDITFFDNDFAGRIAQKQMQAARAVTESTVEFINTIVFALSSVIATLILVVSIDWRVGGLLGLWFAGYLWYISGYLPRIRKRAEGRAAARAVVTGQVVDTITNMRTVKLFAHDQAEDEAAIQAMDRYRERTLDYGTISTSFRYGLMVIAGILPVLMVGFTLWLWTRGGATAGDIAATGTVALRIAQMTGWVSFALMGLYANVGEAEDGMNTLAHNHSMVDAPDAVPLRSAEGIRFDDVTFAYGRDEDSEGQAGVQDLNLAIAPHEKIGLVGASGAGKSTLVALLLRLYDVEKGRVLVGTQDIREVTQESLRHAIGMVTQETAMFNRSAADNIRYGRPDATDEEVIAAARAARAHDFILQLEDFKGRTGYDAHLGERGVKLSGGQRQRIALARAMLKDAPILVLDEATSALDSEVEAEIQAALEEAMVGKTVIAIAHRLSTIASMDRIVVMDQGTIVEEGTHDALLARGGLYARYWNRQSGGFLQMDAEAAE
ncbi:ABC transporter, transmembrane ATP-binding protein [Rubellimicrobium mesophilum DSM 19309]|uniref:ABC transporter, transmembrane ATP-binding protein n=1 Tax=Rubellimicrobium mesophilum DSM 19309 TaxID=442562 RepID=A0A017HLI9_9RHOB|nr:ABC transporter, transmembrane ATP-binding protein [Rubellimicrobium mesophilum DSM 19309]